MSNRKDLKAFVRYDGTGRIIPGSLILQRSKPKVGDWKQIDAYECCNPTTSSTTTEVPVSDFRLKTNIVPTGNTIAGLKEYTWEWNDLAKYIGVDNNPTKGVMAQEAIDMYPQYVHYDETIGFFRVDYEAIKNQQ